MLPNIYDNYRISSENYRNAFVRHISYLGDMKNEEKESVMKDINRMREIAGYDAISAFGEAAGLNKSTLNKLEEADNPSMPHINTLNKLAKKAHFKNYADFLRKEGSGSNYKIIEVPIMATAPGGAWLEAVDDASEKILYAPQGRGLFKGVRILGRSMNRLIDDGGIAIVDISQIEPDKLIDQPVIIECNGEITAKIYRRNPERFEPYSDDPGFQTIFPNGECKIIGRIVDSVKRMPKRIP